MHALMLTLYQEDCCNIAVSEKSDVDVNILTVDFHDNYEILYSIFSGDVFRDNLIEGMRKTGIWDITITSKTKYELGVIYKMRVTDAWKGVVKSGGKVIPPIIISNGVERWIVLAPDKHSRNTVIENLEISSNTYVEKVKEIEVDSLIKIFANIDIVSKFAESLEKLTEIQLKTLKQAHSMGYYEVPRKCSLFELAKLNGVSKNAFLKRLRGAEKKIIGSLFQ